MNKINLNDLDQADLLKIIKDVQYALDGKWDRDSDLHYDTGIPMDDCADIMDSINKLLAINTH